MVMTLIDLVSWWTGKIMNSSMQKIIYSISLFCQTLREWNQPAPNYCPEPTSPIRILTVTMLKNDLRFATEGNFTSSIKKTGGFWSRADGWCNDMCRYWILLASGTKQTQHYDGIKFKSWSLSHVAANLPPQAWLWSMGRMLSHVSRGHSAFAVYV